MECTGGEVAGSAGMTAGVLCIAILGLVVWAHHMYTSRSSHPVPSEVGHGGGHQGILLALGGDLRHRGAHGPEDNTLGGHSVCATPLECHRSAPLRWSVTERHSAPELKVFSATV